VKESGVAKCQHPKDENDLDQRPNSTQRNTFFSKMKIHGVKKHGYDLFVH
jgi:hypothetical protein